MRFWTIMFLGLLLCLPSLGCQSFKSSEIGGKTKGLLGLASRNRRSTHSVDSDEILDPLGARDANRLLWDDLTLDQLTTTVKSRTASNDPAEARQNFQQGKQLYDSGIQILESSPNGEEHLKAFVEAANHFRLASAQAPETELEEEALFFEGESYFFADRYVQANRAFEKLLHHYSGTRYLDMAESRRYAIAIYWLQLSEAGSSISFNDPKRPRGNAAAEARRILHRIKLDDPTGKLADDATLALGQAFLTAQRYYEAADSFEDLRRNYPGSEHIFKAHMLELEARLKGYQGKSYDDTPLRKADELMKTIVRQFPDQARDQLDYLEGQATLIRNQIAERDYAMGQYFEGRGENLAAKIYYEKVADKYQQTELGRTVEQQIADVSQKPPRPEPQLKWLINLFPNPEKEKPVILSGNNEGLLRR